VLPRRGRHRTNYNVKRYTKNTLFDEKIGGTIHLALGAGYSETGNKNRSGLHWTWFAIFAKAASCTSTQPYPEERPFLNRKFPQPKTSESKTYFFSHGFLPCFNFCTTSPVALTEVSRLPCS